MNKSIIKSDKLFAESFLNQSHPYFTHEENLDMSLDYYTGLTSQFIYDSVDLKYPIPDLINGSDSL